MLLSFLILGTVAIVALVVGQTRSKSSRDNGVGRASGKLRVVFICFVLIGAIMTVYEGRHIQFEMERKRWPTTTGTVVSAEVLESGNVKPNIEFEYGVDGQRYQSNSDLQVPNFGAPSTQRDVAQKSVQDNMPGTNVVVFYNPTEPAIALLKPGPSWDRFTRFSFGVIVYGMGIFFYPFIKNGLNS